MLPQHDDKMCNTAMKSPVKLMLQRALSQPPVFVGTLSGYPILESTVLLHRRILTWAAESVVAENYSSNCSEILGLQIQAIELRGSNVNDLKNLMMVTAKRILDFHYKCDDCGQVHTSIESLNRMCRQVVLMYATSGKTSISTNVRSNSVDQIVGSCEASMSEVSAAMNAMKAQESPRFVKQLTSLKTSPTKAYDTDLDDICRGLHLTNPTKVVG